MSRALILSVKQYILSYPMNMKAQFHKSSGKMSSHEIPHILIIDDEKAMCISLKKLLEKNNPALLHRQPGRLQQCMQHAQLCSIYPSVFN